VDLTRTVPGDLVQANIILRPITTLVHNFFDPNLDIWGLINWIFVSFYWLILHDLGQIAPTTYAYENYNIIGDPIGVPNASIPATYHPTANNIFINDTLYQRYASYMRDELVPLGHFLSVPDFMPLDDSNQLQQIETKFLRSYNCLQRQWKGILSAVVSVLAANYALFFGAYSIFIFVAGWFQKRRDKFCKVSVKPRLS
jgi:hypothetical protein